MWMGRVVWCKFSERQWDNRMAYLRGKLKCMQWFRYSFDLPLWSMFRLFPSTSDICNLQNYESFEGGNAKNDGEQEPIQPNPSPTSRHITHLPVCWVSNLWNLTNSASLNFKNRWCSPGIRPRSTFLAFCTRFFTWMGAVRNRDGLGKSLRFVPSMYTCGD